MCVCVCVCVVCVCVCVTDRQTDRQTDREGHRENSNSKTLFYKDCSLGSFKNLTTSPC